VVSKRLKSEYTVFIVFMVLYQKSSPEKIQMLITNVYMLHNKTSFWWW